MTRPKQNWAQPLASAVNLGTSVAAAIGICLYAGWWLDGKFGKEPLFTMLGLLLGVLSAGKMMWEKLKPESRRPPSSDERAKEEENSDQ